MEVSIGRVKRKLIVGRVGKVLENPNLRLQTVDECSSHPSDKARVMVPTTFGGG